MFLHMDQSSGAVGNNCGSGLVELTSTTLCFGLVTFRDLQVCCEGRVIVNVPHSPAEILLFRSGVR